MKPTGFRKQFTNAADACALAQAIVDTVSKSVLVLDKELRVNRRQPLLLFDIQG